MRKSLVKVLDSSRLDGLLTNLEELDDSRVVAILSPFRLVSKENQDQSISGTQESLFRAMVSGSAGQTRILEWLLQKILTNGDQQFSRLALSNLRYLNNIVDSEAFTRSLMETLQACPPAVQRDLIEAIPEIVDDMGHKVTVEGLQSIMDENASFTGVILDTYSCLNMSPALITDIRNELLKRFDSIKDDFLPTTMKFLLQTTPTKSLGPIIQHIRDDLKLCSAQILKDRAAPLNYHRMTLETMRTAMSFDERIATAFLGAISASPKTITLDLWVLFMIHGLNDKLKTKVEALFRRKVLSQDITQQLVRKSLFKMGEVLSPYYPAVLSLAERAVRSIDLKHVALGTQLYVYTFVAFPSLMHRQDLVTNILAHVGSQSEGECSAGLDVLVSLTSEPSSRKELKELWMFVETVLDHLGSLSKANTRKAWKMFTTLIWTGSAMGEPLDQKIYSVLCMVLRKQVTNMRDVYKRSGMIGIAALIGELCSVSKTFDFRLVERDFNLHSAAAFELPDARYKALFLDELASVLQAPHRTFLPVIVERLSASAFELFESFVVPCNAKADVCEGIEVSCALLGAPGTTAINFWRETGTSRQQQERLVYLCPLFRLMQAALRITEGSLGNIGGVMSSPLLITPPSFVETFEDLVDVDQHRVILATFHAINWMREGFNTFSDQESAEIQQYMLQRLTQMHDLEEQLEQCLKVRPSSVPCVRDPTAALCASSVGSAAEPAKKKTKSAKKKKGEDAEDQPGGDASGDMDDSVDLPRVRSFSANFRAFDLNIANLLSLPSALNDSEHICSLRPFALHAIIQVMDEYTEVLLEPKKSGPFARKAKELDIPRWNANSAIKVFDHSLLGEHMMRLSSYVAAWVASEGESWMEDEGELEFDHDAPMSASDARAKHEFHWYIVPAQRMAFNVYRRLFSWLHDSAKVASDDDAQALDTEMRQILGHLVNASSPIVVGQGDGSSVAALADRKALAWRTLTSLANSLQSLASANSFCSMLEALTGYGTGRKFAVPVIGGGTPQSSGSMPGSDDPSHYVAISDFCQGFLNEAWPAKAAEVRPVLEKHLLYSNSFHKALQPVRGSMARIVEAAADRGGQSLDVEGYATLTKTTVSVFYKTGFQCLNKRYKNLALEKSITSSADNKALLLKRAHKLHIEFNGMINLIKGKSATKQIMASSLREGRLFLELVQRAMPFFGNTVIMDSKTTLTVLKMVQDSTRMMMRLCNQAKDQGERVLLPLVPAMKKLIEKLLIETCRIFESGGFSGAVKYGALQHRDVAGKQLSSQVSYWAGNDNQGNDEDEDEDDDAGEEERVAPALVKRQSDDEEDEDEDEEEEDPEEVDLGNDDEPAEEPVLETLCNSE